MRIRYIDESQKEGELDLAHVHVGDRLRFRDEYRRLAGPTGVVVVAPGAEGIVTKVGAEGLAATVEAAVRTRKDETFTEPADVELDARDLAAVAILVDSRDPRLGTSRIAGLEVWELEHFLRAVPTRQCYAVVELERQGQHRAAAFVRAASSSSWAALAATWRTAAAIDLFEEHGWFAAEAVELAQWAVTAMASEGRSYDLRDHADVLEALEALIDDVRGGPYRTEVSLDEGAEGLDYVEQTLGESQPDRQAEETLKGLQTAWDYIAALPPEQWARVVADVHQEAPLAAERLRERELERLPLDVPLEDEEPAEPPTPELSPTEAVPIRWKPGGPLVGQTVWVKPRIGDMVYVPLTGRTDVIVGFAAPDTVLTTDGSAQSAYDAADVYLKTPDSGRPEVMDPDVMKAWKTRRKSHPPARRPHRIAWHEVCYQASDGDTGCPPRGGAPNHDSRAGSSGFSWRAGVGADLRLCPGSDDGEPDAAGSLGARAGLSVAGAEQGVSARGRPDGLGRAALGPLGIRQLREWLRRPEQFAALSAYRDDRSKAANQAEHSRLIAMLQESGYSPSQLHSLRGQYFRTARDKKGNPILDENGKPKTEMVAEQSYLVLGMGLERALDFGREFKQDSIIYKSPEGVVGAYYPAGGKARLALSGDDVPVGEDAAVIRSRAPKPVHRGPPSPADPWSKARSIGFEFPIDWETPFEYSYENGVPRPISREEARTQLRQHRGQGQTHEETPSAPEDAPDPREGNAPHGRYAHPL